MTRACAQPITVEVGPKRTEIFVHRDLLLKSSKFFRAELEIPGNQVIQLLSTKPEIFGIYVNWLYCGHARLFEEDNADPVFKGWPQCYSLGAYLGDSDFQDAIIDRLIGRMISSASSPKYIGQTIYAHSDKPSFHRKLAIDITVRNIRRDHIASAVRVTDSPDFTEDILSEIAANLQDGLKFVGLHILLNISDTCKYHEHTRLGQPCYKTRRNANV